MDRASDQDAAIEEVSYELSAISVAVASGGSGELDPKKRVIGSAACSLAITPSAV